LDIGSGFGKPVFHAAIQIGCSSIGVEVVPARVEYCMDFFYRMEERYKEKLDLHNKEKLMVKKEQETIERKSS
jgi:cyclopropane fatty-acyl-phospholipid synthase-like methyltransferase